jgi:RNA polymerase sigma-70 factor (ECF subfamily)
MLRRSRSRQGSPPIVAAQATSAGEACLSLVGAEPHVGVFGQSFARPRAREQAAQAEALLRAQFGRLVAEYEAKIYNVIYRLVDSHEEAEDLTQETFIAAYNAFDRFRGDASFYTWLYRIAVNRAKNRLKQMGRQRASEVMSLDTPVEFGDQDIEREIGDDHGAPHVAMENNELGEFLGKCVKALQPDFKAVVVLRDYQGLSYKEIAEIEDCSVKAVKSRLFRARSILRSKLGRYLQAVEM